MPELIRIEVPEDITINARQPDGSMKELPYSFENYVVFLINNQKSFNTTGPGVRASVSILNALKEMNASAKKEEEETKAEEDGKADESPAPETEPEPEVADEGKKEEGETEAIEKATPKLIFIVDQEDWKMLREASEKPDNGYPFAQMGLAARTFITFMDALNDADPDKKDKKKE